MSATLHVLTRHIIYISHREEFTTAHPFTCRPFSFSSVVPVHNQRAFETRCLSPVCAVTLDDCQAAVSLKQQHQRCLRFKGCGHLIYEIFTITGHATLSKAADVVFRALRMIDRNRCDASSCIAYCGAVIQVKWWAPIQYMARILRPSCNLGYRAHLRLPLKADSAPST